MLKDIVSDDVLPWLWKVIQKKARACKPLRLSDRICKVSHPLMFSTKNKERREVLYRRKVLKRINRNGNARRPSGHAATDSQEEPTWDDIVFQHRNKDYGAYAVRQGYRRNVLVGVEITLVITFVILLWPSVSRWLSPTSEAPAPMRKLVYSELTLPPPIDRPKPPPPQVQIPRLKKVIKFVTPKVVREQIEEIPPTITELKENEVSSEDAEGPVSVEFEEPAEVVAPADDDEIFTFVDQQPEYAGGYDAMMAFIMQNMKYPARARQMRIEGTVHVSFVVAKTGEITDVKVLRGIMAECDQEAIRVIRMMPPWKPGKQNGRPVNVRFVLPLKFRLN